MVVDTFGFRLLTLLHILAVIVAFAPAFVWPVVAGRLKRSGQPTTPVWSMAAGVTPRVHGPALVLAGIFGFGLVGMSRPPGADETVYSFGDAWISVAMLLWFLMLGILFGLLMPAEKRAAAGDASAEKLTSMAGGVLHLLLAVMLVVMIWKPGL